MACVGGGPLQLGVKSSLFPTVYVDERSGKRAGINVEILETLAHLEQCDGAEYTEYSSEESFCTDDRCVNALSKAVLNGSVFADVDSIQLTSTDISLYRYSLPVDVPRLVMMEGRPATVKEIAMDLRSYTVYNVDSAALLILLLLFRMILRFLRSRLAAHSQHDSGLFRTLIGFIDFISKLFHVISIFLIVLFYQCYFAGNVLVEHVQKEEFVSVIEDLLNGTRRLLIDTGVLMENEYTAFGPGTTVMTNEHERLERLCNEEDDVVLLWDDQLFGLAKFNQELVMNCRINRIDIPAETNNHPVPRLEKSLEVGEPLYFLMPRSTRRKTVERINQILTTIFTHDLRNSLHVRRYIPARTHGAAFDAYRATFPSGAKFPAFLETNNAQQSRWIRATSLIHLLYPLIALCVGLSISEVAMACAGGGPLQLGVKSSLFPTVYVDERSGQRAGINVEIFEILARLEKCDGTEYTEYSTDESFCTENRCVNALSKAVMNGSVFADVDSIQLTSTDISLYRYSLPVDVPRLVMLEGRPDSVKEIAIDLRFYTVYNIDSAALLILLLLFRLILGVLRSRLVTHSNNSNGLMCTLIGFIDFISRLFHVITIFLIVLFYQCYFEGNVLVEQVQKEEFASVIEDLLNGTRRLLIDTGVLMENEYTAFGPGTTVMIKEQERLERLCNEGNDVVLLWDDQLFGFANANQELIKNCRINRIDIPTETNNHPVPRLEKSLENGEPLYFLMPRFTRRKTVERINQIITTIFTHDLRNSLHVRRYIPARSHGSAFDAYRATFPSGAKFPAFLETNSVKQSHWFRAISLIHLLYPLIALCVGLSLSVIVFLAELSIKHQRERIEQKTLSLRKLTLIKQISIA